MGFFDFFKKKEKSSPGIVEKWQELGRYSADFFAFGNDIYKSSLVRSCIRPLAMMTSKAEIKCSDASLERLMNNRPNMYMNGREFLQKVRTLYELRNNVFIYIDRDERAKVVGLYPVPYTELEALEYQSKLFVKFRFANSSAQPLTVAWEDLAVLRKDYYLSDICGDDNTPLLQNLELINITNQGLSNAVRATANLRGILKSTKGMLSPEDVRKQKEAFVRDYLSLENEGGIASIDATQEFTPISMSPIVTTYTQMKEFRENVYRYFGVNDNIVQGNLNPEQIESFCETKIIPFLVDLSQELTSKIFAGKALAYECNWIILEINKLQFATTSTKLSMTALVDRGAMTPNEWRKLFGLDPVEGGDEMIRRLDTATVKEKEESNEDENEDGSDENKDEKEEEAK